MRRPDASTLRKEYSDLCAQARELAPLFCGRSPLWRGIVYPLRRRCGRTNCRCAHGEPHETTVLSDRSGRRHRLIGLRPAEIAIFERMTEAYRKVRQARTQLLAIQKAMIEALDRLTALRLQEGKRRAPARVARRKRKKRR